MSNKFSKTEGPKFNTKTPKKVLDEKIATAVYAK